MSETPTSHPLTEAIVSAANYPGIFNELMGYVGQAIDDGESLDPRELFEYLRDLKRRYVTDPVRAAIGEAVDPAQPPARAATATPTQPATDEEPAT